MVDKLEAGVMKPWVGGAKPADWDGKTVQFRSGEIRHAEPGVVWKLGWDHSYGSGDIIAYSVATPTNGEQVERAFRAGWEQACITVDPCNGFHEEDYAEARSEILATLSTPTEDARERVKVLEEALEDICNPMRYLRRVAEAEGKMLGGMAYTIANDISTLQRIARTALGNKQTPLSLSDANAENPQKTAHFALGNKETDRHG